MNIYSHPIDEVFESLKTFHPDLLSLEENGNISPLEFDVPWNKGISGYTRQPHSEESKEKISQAKKGVPSPLRGRSVSEESKKKNRQTHLGKTLNQTTKDKIGLSRTGQLHSEETKIKISKANAGKPSQLKGILRSDDIKKKISEGKRGKKRVYREDGTFYMK